ncbi:MAG: SOS response-associated peptidase [Halorhabdus sp.]
MCGRYGLFTPPRDLQTRFEVTSVTAFEPTYNAAPGESLPIIADEAPERIQRRRWGLIPAWADDPDDHGHINARAETLFETPSFREAAEQRRCLVLADGFYEWGPRDGERWPHFFRRPDGEPFAMAGLWERFRPSTTQTALGRFGAGATATDAGTVGADAPGSGPDPIETFTIVTTAANETVAGLHDRMPVILPTDREREWLRADRETAAELLRPFSGDLEGYPVSRTVNDPTNDSPALVEPIED